MKQKLLSALLMSAFAGVATTASAGVIQASYKNYAAEAFGADVTMIAPTVGYSLALPLTGTASNPNSFNVSYTLANGAKWDAANLPGATLVSTNGTDFLDGATGTVDASGSVITFSFTLNNGKTFPTGSTIVLGTNAVATSVNNPAAPGWVEATTGNGGIKNVYTTLQKPALPAAYCVPTTASIGISIKLTNAAGNEFESNFGAAPLSNSTTILQSGVATTATVTSGAKLGALAANNEASKIDVLNPSLGKFFTTDAGDVTAAASTTKLNLGSIAFSDINTLYDLNGVASYSVANDVAGPPAVWTDAVGATGVVSQNGIAGLTITGKFVTGGAVTITTSPDCTGVLAGTTVAFDTARTTATIAVTKADLQTVALAGGARTVYACYTVPGTKVISAAQFAVTGGTLAKVAASNELDTPICPGAMYNLVANGVQVDVRNYIPAIVEAPSGGWKNVVRVINTDESQPSVDVYGTALLRNGDLGATAIIAAAMKPREVRYLSGAEIDAKLDAAATASAKSFGADDIAANARLRITAASASIRVQNYHFNPATGNYLEASASQGDDGSVAGGAPTIADVIRARADGQNK